MYSNFEEKGKIFTQVVTKKPINVTIQTTNQLIRGKIHIRPEDRVKDELNRKDLFIAVTDAIVFSSTGEALYHSGFLSVNTEQIIWLMPDEEVKPARAIK
ncbi:MAG: hypothetical protein GYA15_02585 [Leptolinea sp.]|jgi:hypothetical protein|nr:hypothetical protein [Leptolinea sp.]